MILNDQSQQAKDFLDKHVHVRANLLINDLIERYQKDWDFQDFQWYQDLFLRPQEPENNTDDSENLDDYCLEPDLEYREPYEFYIVSDFFAQKLKENNELLTKHWDFWIWGRETTGQSILIDYVFQKIYNDFKNS